MALCKSIGGKTLLILAALLCLSWAPAGPTERGGARVAAASDDIQTVSDYRSPRARPYRYRNYECVDVHIGYGRWERRCRPIHYGPPYWPYVYRPYDGWRHDRWDDHDRWKDRRYDRRWWDDDNRGRGRGRGHR